MDKTSKAIDILKNGGIVIYPTDTAFGIGCRVDSSNSVDRLFAIRRRSKSKAMPVLINSLSMAKKYWTTPLPNIVRHLANSYWPGAVTIIYTANTTITPPLVRGGSNSIGLRIPNHKIPIKLIASLNCGLIGASANFAGDPTPYRFEDLNSKLMDRVDYVLSGTCLIKKPSTVVDCKKDPISIIRQGAVTI